MLLVSGPIDSIGLTQSQAWRATAALVCEAHLWPARRRPTWARDLRRSRLAARATCRPAPGVQIDGGSSARGPVRAEQRAHWAGQLQQRPPAARADRPRSAARAWRPAERTPAQSNLAETQPGAGIGCHQSSCASSNSNSSPSALQIKAPTRLALAPSSKVALTLIARDNTAPGPSSQPPLLAPNLRSPWPQFARRAKCANRLTLGAAGAASSRKRANLNTSQNPLSA